jgi:AcrR family transcriptional regulator
VTTEETTDLLGARRQRRRRRVEELILDSATQIFLTKGMATTTMQNISEAADVAQGTLYNYFPNKEALTVAVGRRLMKTYGRELLEHELARGGLDPLDMVAIATIQLVSQGATDPVWRAMVDRYDVLADALHDELQEFAMANLKQAAAQGLLPRASKTLHMFWRLGAWVIAGAIRDIVKERLPQTEIYNVAMHVLMQQGIEPERASAIVRKARGRIARSRKSERA